MTINEFEIQSKQEVPQVFHPWRRYLARTLDIFLYSVIWLAFLAFLLHINLMNRNNLWDVFDSFVAIAIMLGLEPLLLLLFRTTPGKAIMGLVIIRHDGRRLTYSEAFARTWSVIGSGMGYNIPIYNLIRLWKSYKLCEGKEPQPWDESISYTIKDTKRYRGVLYVGSYAAIIAVIFTIISAQMLPPERGDLTVGEFVENYNYYAKLLDADFGNQYLSEDGKWTEKEYDGTIYIGTENTEKPEYHFTIENGYVTSVLLTVEIKNNEAYVSPYDEHMILASLAFAGAQKEVGLFSKTLSQIEDLIRIQVFRDFGFHKAGLLFACSTEYSGYMDATSDSFLLPVKNKEENYYSLKFSISKQR